MYRLHQRTVDVEGYVSVNSIRYSVPVPWIGRRVEVRETRDKIDIELDARHIVTHDRALTPLHQRIMLAERPGSMLARLPLLNSCSCSSK